MAELAIEMEKPTLKLSDLQKGSYHIRVVDTPRTQEQSPTLKSDNKKNKSRWTKDTIAKHRDHKEQNKMVLHMFWLTLSRKSENKNQLKTWTMNRIYISSTPSRKNPIASRGFSLPKSFVRGHGRRSPSHPRPPWPRWAAGRPRRGLLWLPHAAVCCLGKPRPYGPSPAGRTQRNRRGDKLWEKFGTSKIKLWTLRPLKIVPGLNKEHYGTLWVWDVSRPSNCFR